MVVFNRPVGNTKIFSFLLYQTETMPDITAMASIQVVCTKPLYIDSNRKDMGIKLIQIIVV